MGRQGAVPSKACFQAHWGQTGAGAPFKARFQARWRAQAWKPPLKARFQYRLCARGRGLWRSKLEASVARHLADPVVEAAVPAGEHAAHVVVAVNRTGLSVRRGRACCMIDPTAAHAWKRATPLVEKKEPQLSACGSSFCVCHVPWGGQRPPLPGRPPLWRTGLLRVRCPRASPPFSR